MTNEPVANGVGHDDAQMANGAVQPETVSKPVQRNSIVTFVANFIWTIQTIVIVLYYSIIGAFRAMAPSAVLRKKSVKNEIVLITGAGSGMGRLFAERFSKLGAKLVLWDVNQKENEATAKKCQEAGAEHVYTFTVDVSKKNDVQKTAEKVKDKVGTVFMLVNNAGIVTGKSLLECPDESMERTMAVNANAHFWTTKAFLGPMMEQNHGHILQIVSAAGAFGVGGLTDYCASKFAAFGFSESLLAELHLKKVSGVNMTVVCPCYVDTGMFDGAKMDSPTLLPMLKPEYVVEKSIDAALTDTPLLFLPRFVYVMYFFKGLLPVRALLYIGQELGVINSMNHFQGRQAKTNEKKIRLNFSPFKN